MRQLLNTLFITKSDSYLALEGENVVVLHEEKVAGRFPLHTIESILHFGYKGASPALMGACVKRGVSLCFLSPSGHFWAQVYGETRGNVLLRKTQVRASDCQNRSCKISRHFIAGKLYNSRWMLERATRDHPLRVDVAQLKKASQAIKDMIKPVMLCEELDTLRGMEGKAAVQYFSVIDQLILHNKDVFYFKQRTRRPPMDCLNALLSFGYMLLAHDCAAALESVGLDPYIGFLHRDRPGRRSLALDLMEELRPVVVDRLIITIINSKTMTPKHFKTKENRAVLLTDEGRKTFLTAWQKRKQEVITHPFLNEKIQWGLVPYVQALLLARFLRDDLDSYPPFLWK